MFTAKYDTRAGHFTGQVLGGPDDDLCERDEALFGPVHIVTSLADSGAGSLRQTILDVHRECTERNAHGRRGGR